MTAQLRWPDVAELTRAEQRVHNKLLSQIGDSKGSIADVLRLTGMPINVVVTENGGGFSFQKWLYQTIT